MADSQPKITIYKPQAGGQEAFVRSSVDICIFGGSLGGGKSAGAIMSVAEPSLDSNFRAVFFRRTLGELKTAGGIVDEFSKFYGDSVTVTKSENPRITFKNSGAWIECRQIADENPDKVRETFKGSQWDAAFFEELTGFTFNTWNYLASRVRGTSWWSGKVRATTNPSKKHWVRKMLDWYIGEDGLVIPERSGVVRYVYLDGNSVDDYVWGDTKEEVYLQCKASIDKKLSKLKDDSITYENLIKSFTFILGSLAENKALIENNPDYVGNVSGREGDALLMGNWNVDFDAEEETAVNLKSVRKLRYNDPQTNGRRSICADLADTGTNATIIGVFDGLHWIDAMVLPVSTPKQNADWIKKMMRKHDIAETHVIYDAQRAAYMLDYLPNAIGYYSFSASRGKYRMKYKRRKDENAARLIEAINKGYFSIEPDVADMIFNRTKNGIITIENKLIEECKVVAWAEDVMSGKQRLLEKKEMNSHLGRGESMDVWDMISSLMSEYATEEYGDEVNSGRRAVDEDMEAEGCVNIYDDSIWA